MNNYRTTVGRYKLRLKLRVIKLLGGKCNCCGEDNPLFLTVDHIHNNEVEHRFGFRGSRAVTQVYQDVLQSGNPQETYQLLCMNCNAAKQWYGVCPHQSDLETKAAYEELEKLSRPCYKLPSTVRKDSKGRWTSFVNVLADGGYS